MTRRKTESLRLLTDSERQALGQLSRSSRESTGQVAQAKGLLAVTAGKTYTEAAVAAGRKTGDTVARWVSEFNGKGWLRWSAATVAGQPSSMALRSANAF